MVRCALRSGVGFCREKNAENSDLDAQNFGHSVHPVKLKKYNLEVSTPDFFIETICQPTWLLHEMHHFSG
jgi:hypothetical protein